MRLNDANEPKYVKLEDVLFVLNALHERSNTTARFAYSNAYNHIKNLDGEDVVPVKHGHWKMAGTAYACSVCNEGDPFGMAPFCRWCGAKMDEVSE